MVFLSQPAHQIGWPVHIVGVCSITGCNTVISERGTDISLETIGLLMDMCDKGAFSANKEVNSLKSRKYDHFACELTR